MIYGHHGITTETIPVPVDSAIFVATRWLRLFPLGEAALASSLDISGCPFISGAAVCKTAGSDKYHATFQGYPLEVVPAGLDLPPVSDRWTVLHGVNDKGHA